MLTRRDSTRVLQWANDGTKDFLELRTGKWRDLKNLTWTFMSGGSADDDVPFSPGEIVEVEEEEEEEEDEEDEDDNVPVFSAAELDQDGEESSSSKDAKFKRIFPVFSGKEHCSTTPIGKCRISKKAPFFFMGNRGLF